MSRISFLATLVTLVVLLTAAVLLLGPTLTLSRESGAGAVGPGTLPLFTILGIIGLGGVLGVKEVFRFRKARGDRSEPPSTEAASALRRSAVVSVLLVVGAIAWHQVGFLAGAILFFCLLSLFLLPEEKRTKRHIGQTLAVAVVFCVATWLLFDRLLSVPLH